ncbi:hypothetical protein AAVH_25566 [Aphelenchoides avenae]|nr:hypothetical protein AAVH_25566 [Aphelenchus avenae]
MDYCLLYRMVVILEDTRYHQLLVTKAARVGGQSFGVCVSIAVGTVLYKGFITERGAALELVRNFPASVPLLRPELPVAALDYKKPWVLIAFSCIFFGLILSEAVSFGVVYVIIRTLRAHSASFSAKTYRMHLQLTVLLLVQLCSPVVFLIFPIIHTIYDVFTDNEITPTTGRIGFMLLSMYASLNSMLTLFFVTPYRRYTVERLAMLLRFFRRPIGGATSPL